VRIGDPNDTSLPFGVTLLLDILVPRNTSVRALTNAGDLRVAGITGPVDCEADSGSIEIAGIESSVRLSSDSGRIRIASLTSGAADALLYVTESAASRPPAPQVCRRYARNHQNARRHFPHPTVFPRTPRFQRMNESRILFLGTSPARETVMRGLTAYAEALSVAAGSLRSSKLRSFLTLLGIILATATLIVVMSMVHGMDVYVAEEVSDMGTDGFQLQRIPMLGDFDPKKLLELERKNPKLTAEEYEFLKGHGTLVRELGMQTDRNVSVHFRGHAIDGVDLMGMTPNVGIISNIQVDYGRFLTDFDDRKRLDVAVIGNDVREKLFVGSDPVGKTIAVSGKPYEIVGIAAKRGSVFGYSRDNFIAIPIHSFFKTFGFRPDMGFAALAIDHARLQDAQDETRALLRAYRRLRPNQEDNFGLLASASLVGLWDRLTGVLSTMAIGIVSVFMVVGGVVVMNIMLAVVTERTYEIGIRKAAGATRGDILRQFLIESSLLSAAGGLIGTVLAWTIAVLVRTATPMPMAVPPSAVVVGVGLSAMVGLFFGVYPARRAAMLDPIHALRWER
jgi:putative ABC transport system permease protein